jgi:hypothetical protein
MVSVLRAVVAVLTMVVAVVGAIPTIARGVAPSWLYAALIVGVTLLLAGIGLSRTAWHWQNAYWREEPAVADEHLSAERRGEMEAAAARAAREMLRERASDPGRVVRQRRVRTRKPRARGRRTGALSPVTAGGAALTLAILTGIGTAIAGDVTAATHIAQQPSSAPPGETCTEVVEQVSELARQDPQVAARYARGEAGLPTLVEPATRKRCGGSFAALLQQNHGPRTRAGEPPDRRHEAHSQARPPQRGAAKSPNG